jgi:hypothetical protein
VWRDIWSFLLWALETRIVLIPTSLGDLIGQASIQQLIIETVYHFEHLLFHGVFRRVVYRYFLRFLMLRRFLMDVLPEDGAVG